MIVSVFWAIYGGRLIGMLKKGVIYEFTKVKFNSIELSRN